MPGVRGEWSGCSEMTGRANAKITSMTSSQSSRGRHRVRLLEAPDRKMGCGSHRLTEIKEEKVRKTMFSRVTACVVTFGCRAQNSVVSQGLFDNEQIHWRVLQRTVFGIPTRENHYKMFSASHWNIAVKSEGEYTDARAVLKQDEVQAGASTITKSLLKDKKKKKASLSFHQAWFGNDSVWKWLPKMFFVSGQCVRIYWVCFSATAADSNQIPIRMKKGLISQIHNELTFAKLSLEIKKILPRNKLLIKEKEMNEKKGLKGKKGGFSTRVKKSYCANK